MPKIKLEMSQEVAVQEQMFLISDKHVCDSEAVGCTSKFMVQ